MPLEGESTTAVSRPGEAERKALDGVIARKDMAEIYGGLGRTADSVRIARVLADTAS